MYLKKVYILEVPGNALAGVFASEDAATRAGVHYGTRTGDLAWHVSEGWAATEHGAAGYLVESTHLVPIDTRRVPAAAV